jgi:hypothetical protein
MKAHELIEALKQVNQNAEVRVRLPLNSTRGIYAIRSEAYLIFPPDEDPVVHLFLNED